MEDPGSSSDTSESGFDKDCPSRTPKAVAASITEYLKGNKPESKDSKKSRNDKDEGPMELFINAARWIPLSIDPFINLLDVFLQGMRARTCHPSQRAAMTNDEQYKCIVFQKIMELVPDFLSIMSEFRNDAPTFQKFIKEMTKKMSTTRSNVMSSLKNQIATHIPPNDDWRSTFTLPDVQKKNKWGWNHVVTARLLCPMRLVAEFDEDPDLFLARVQEGRYRVTAGDYPAFLYDETIYEPDNPLAGLFRGYILLRGYRHIFTGPASWLNGEAEGGKQARGVTNKLKAPTPQTIAYTAVMVRWALSSAENWEAKNLLFDYNKFFQNILVTMNADITADMGTEDVDDETAHWFAETMDWWKINVPGLHRNNTTIVTPEDVEDEESDVFKLKAARKGKCNRAKASQIDPQLEPSAQEPTVRHVNPAPPRPEVRPRARPAQAPEIPQVSQSAPTPPSHQSVQAVLQPDQVPHVNPAPPRPEVRPRARPAQAPEIPQVGLSVPLAKGPPVDPRPALLSQHGQPPIPEVNQPQHTPSTSSDQPPASASEVTTGQKRSKGLQPGSGNSAATVPATSSGVSSIFDGELSPVGSPAPPSKKAKVKAKSKQDIAIENVTEKRQTRSHVKKSTRKKF